MFESLSEGLQSAFKSLSGKGKLSEGNMRDGLDIVQKAMLEADVSYSVVQDFMSHVSERAFGKRVLLSLRPHIASWRAPIRMATKTHGSS